MIYSVGLCDLKNIVFLQASVAAVFFCTGDTFSNFKIIQSYVRQPTFKMGTWCRQFLFCLERRQIKTCNTFLSSCQNFGFGKNSHVKRFLHVCDVLRIK